MKRLVKYEPGQCPPEFLQYNIDCNCPVNVNKSNLDIDLDINIPEAPE